MSFVIVLTIQQVQMVIIQWQRINRIYKLKYKSVLYCAHHIIGLNGNYLVVTYQQNLQIKIQIRFILQNIYLFVDRLLLIYGYIWLEEWGLNRTKSWLVLVWYGTSGFVPSKKTLHQLITVLMQLCTFAVEVWFWFIIILTIAFYYMHVYFNFEFVFYGFLGGSCFSLFYLNPNVFIYARILQYFVYCIAFSSSRQRRGYLFPLQICFVVNLYCVYVQGI
eukprot:TRINITY_DN10514_c0_g2_i1.p1 TRINITY_DN10514_c0_g2~~TRINITY_DN10514_c0_g2_i1.p1  ORF type:complete len:220 (-),score=-16.49 TRINITY_DN10514_c0_g2_i1:185-844(-)